MCNTCINDVSSVLENNMKNENMCLLINQVDKRFIKPPIAQSIWSNLTTMV